MFDLNSGGLVSSRGHIRRATVGTVKCKSVALELQRCRSGLSARELIRGILLGAACQSCWLFKAGVQYRVLTSLARADCIVALACGACSFFAAVKSRFLSLLAAPGVQLPQLMQAMGMLLSQRLGLVELSPEDEDMVSRLLSRVFAVDDPIYQKVWPVSRCTTQPPCPHLVCTWIGVVLGRTGA